MKKLIIILVLTLGTICSADPIDNGGERPFPYGAKTQFPWEWVEGCWRPEYSSFINLNIKIVVVGGEKKIRLSGRDKKNEFSGVGSVKNDIVSFLRIARAQKNERTLISLKIGAYCTDSDKPSYDKLCKKVLGLSLMYDTGSGLDQEDHILIRSNAKTCEDLRP